jgi:hypothetical protein
MSAPRPPHGRICLAARSAAGGQVSRLAVEACVAGFALALSSVRGIGWPQVRAAMLLGLAITVWTWIVWLMPILKLWQATHSLAIWVDDLVIDQIKAQCLMAAIVIADRAVDEGAPRRRAYVLAALFGCLAGTLVAEPFGWAWRTSMKSDLWPADWTWAYGTPGLFFWPLFHLTRWLLVGGAVVFLYADRRAARKTAQLLHAAELERIRRSKLALESRLSAMQARVEPQFLFNTLAQVGQLHERDPRLAAQMLDDLIAYLRAAMPQMRDTSSTLAQEIALARAYLGIVRLRLGDRLDVHADAPGDAGSIRMPAMMLLPLIVQAIAPGLDPASSEAEVRVRYVVDHDGLRVIVDTIGFVAATEDDGAAAIRERLAALYRENARLVRRSSGPSRVSTTIEMPCDQEERAAM